MLNLKKEEKNKIEARLCPRFFIIPLLLIILLVLVSCKNNEFDIPIESYRIVENPSNKPIETQEIEEDDEFFFYDQKQITINGKVSEAYIITLDLAKENIKVEPYLSFNKIYGFETLSDMVKRESAYAAVTSGFFYMYGRPSGLFVTNGKVISAGTGRFNSLVIESDKAYFENINTKMHVILGNNEVINIDTLNAPMEGTIQSAIYTRDYGKTNRLHFEHIAIHVVDNTIMSIKKMSDETPIEDEGYLICFKNLPAYIMLNRLDFLKIVIEPTFNLGTNAYECSKMIVENGVNIASDYDPWIGNLNNYDPRTCVGINEEGHLVFIVVDGRQVPYSLGVTGKQLADICIDLGLKDVAMLDGGASAEMIVDGSIMNKLSFQNEERPLAGGFLIFID